MCFSSEASFIASAVIGVTGIIALKKSSGFPFKFFAFVPVFFAFQQLIEGFLWITLQNSHCLQWKLPLTNGFLFFAWLIWPVYIPFSCLLLERKQLIKRFQLVFLVLGLIIAFSYFYIMLFHQVDATISDYHIKYTMDFHPPNSWIYGLIYLIPTVVSMLISSIKKMWILGLVNLLSFIFSKIVFFGYVTSVWCFFGAIASIIVLWIVWNSKKQS